MASGPGSYVIGDSPIGLGYPTEQRVRTVKRAAKRVRLVSGTGRVRSIKSSDTRVRIVKGAGPK